MIPHPQTTSQTEHHVLLFGDVDWVDLKPVMRMSIKWRCPEAPEAVGEKYSSLACLRMEKNGLRTHCVDVEKYEGTFQIRSTLPIHL